MNDVKEDIKKTIEYINTNHPIFQFEFQPYSAVFLNANECISDYMKGMFVPQGKALTICGSGDHILNLLCCGFEEIDSFDINKVAYYYFKLKCAWIMQYSYEQFMDFYFDSPKNENQVFHLDQLDDFSFLDSDTYQFFSSLKNETISKLCYPVTNSFTIVFDNLYLEIKQYEKLKSILKNGFTHQFFHTDIKNISSYLNKIYDYICLSNVGDYYENTLMNDNMDYMMRFEKFFLFCKENVFPFLSEEGKAMFFYLFDARKELDTDYLLNQYSDAVIQKVRTYSGSIAYHYQK